LVHGLASESQFVAVHQVIPRLGGLFAPVPGRVTLTSKFLMS
jgi:hypothetical protein